MTAEQLACALLVITLLAAITDTRTGLIPNWLTLPVLVVAPPLHLALGGTGALASSVIGCIVCALVPLGLFRAGAMGGGDVKLFSGLGALAGPLAGIELQWLAYNVLVVLALGTLARRGELVPVLKRSWRLLRGGSRGESTPSEPLTTFRLGAPIFVAAVIQLALTRAP